MFHPVGTGPYKFVEWKQTDYLKGVKMCIRDSARDVQLDKRGGQLFPRP